MSNTATLTSGSLVKLITISLYDTEADGVALEVGPKTKFTDLLPLLQSEVFIQKLLTIDQRFIRCKCILVYYQLEIRIDSKKEETEICQNA
jgi:hypothetical protein